jgi:uncharacterized protein Yka (UPF0111/DUF47 family)
LDEFPLYGWELDVRRNFLNGCEPILKNLPSQAALVRTAPILLSQEAVSEENFRSRFATNITALERDGHHLVRETVACLNRDYSSLGTFVPGRKEFQGLSSCLDDILEAIEEAAFRLSACRCQRLAEGVPRLCGCLASCADGIYAAVNEMVQGTGPTSASSAIRLLAKRADDLARTVLLDLFSNEDDAIVLLKDKEICDLLAQTVKLCEDTAKQFDVMETSRV